MTRDIDAFLAHARSVDGNFGPATARAAFLVAPDGFRRAEQSAADNRYMAADYTFDAIAASAQHRDLQRAVGGVLPTVCFAGDPQAPDGLFPNNVFGTAPGRLVLGRMRHPVRQREATRADIRAFFTGMLGYDLVNLSTQPHACELTGALVIDRARGLGFCGLSERCDETGARLMHDAFGLRATLLFDLAAGEYHANVVLAVLAGRAALVCADGFADPRAAEAIGSLYGPHALLLSARQQAAFAANAIALDAHIAWMSAAGAASLGREERARLADAGFGLRAVPMDAIEAAGGSLRCCVAEIF